MAAALGHQMKRGTCHPLLALLMPAVLVACVALEAHEFWIAVTAPRLEVGATASFVVGFAERFPIPISLPDPGEIPIRIFSPSGGTVPLRGRSRLTPEGLLTGTFPGATEPGLYVIDAAIYGKALDYTAGDFQAYLTRERLSSAVAFRKALREEDRAAREVVTMFAKTVVRVGTVAGSPQVLGTRLEFVPLNDPTSLRQGDTLRLRLLFNNGRAANAPITAIRADDDAEAPALTSRTNGSGEIHLVLSRPGVWLVRAVQTVPRGAAPQGGVTEWSSYWASLTVSVGSR